MISPRKKIWRERCRFRKLLRWAPRNANRSEINRACRYGDLVVFQLRLVWPGWSFQIAVGPDDLPSRRRESFYAVGGHSGSAENSGRKAI